MKSNNSRGYKWIVSLSGLSLILFLTIHLSINLLAMVDKNVYNEATDFMQRNFAARTTENILALGFLIHIVLATRQAIADLKKKKDNEKRLSGPHLWGSKNMLILGGLIVCFLSMHLIQVWSKLNTNNYQTEINGVVVNDAYTFVSQLFSNSFFYSLVYIATGIALGLHMRNGFLSALQSLNLKNEQTAKTLRRISFTIGLFFAIGFSSIPVFFLLKNFHVI